MSGELKMGFHYHFSYDDSVTYDEATDIVNDLAEDIDSALIKFFQMDTVVDLLSEQGIRFVG